MYYVNGVLSDYHIGKKNDVLENFWEFYSV